ncbi:DUF1104 domain-containing protein [Helicobacter marmotae]|uniref:DUF1104 domain-containing protein n=1 Tax=Helicobacter marmotae TaxID=152490 RepID=A0A3D8I6D0_9HELI|nr:DUF1104 domain-containing protein [Helicobacter marmotae]RDU60730.1 DUF1104 domain-containing protein [Helicobacter marmotae]
MKVTHILLAGLLGMSFGYGIDLSKKKDSELVKLQGTLKGEDAIDLALEVRKRIAKMNEKAKTKFMEEIKASYNKATENWIAKDLRAYEKEVKDGVKARVEKMDEKQKKEYGFSQANQADCPHCAHKH